MAKTLANYDPLVQIPSGMTPAGADFPIVESHDILVGENDKRLDAKLDDIDSAIGNVGQTPIATQLSSKVNTSDIQTTVRDASSASDSKIPSEKAVRSAIEAKTINVDSTVTQGSTNAVSGGAVHTQLATKQDALTFDTTPTASSSNPVTSGGVKAALDTKQDALTFDTTPTASSSNPVTSGGVKAALDNKQNTLTYETTPIAGSVNPVTSTGIRNAIDTAAAQNLGAMQAQYTEFVADADAVLGRASSLSNGMVACSNIAAETTVGDTRILLYTGTTNSTYTNGHWYYNSAASNAAPSWTDGGAVGSAPTIDNTLTVEGAAANSKAVGDAIENIVTISNTQPGSNSGNKVWIKETTSEEVQIPTYAEHIAKANKADIATNNESDNGSGTITASKKYAIGDHFYINNTNTSSENYGVSTLYKATAAIASGDAIVVGTNCEASKVADEITSLSNDIDTVKADLTNTIIDIPISPTFVLYETIKSTAGEFLASGSERRTDYIELLSDTFTLAWNDGFTASDSLYVICFYDANKQYVSGQTTPLSKTKASNTFVIDNMEVKYLAYCGTHASMQGCHCYFSKNSVVKSIYEAIDAKEDIYSKSNIDGNLWDVGIISAANGQDAPSSTALRTAKIKIDGIDKIAAENGYKISIYGWRGSQYIGFYTGSVFTKQGSALDYLLDSVEVSALLEYGVNILRVGLRKSDRTDININEYTNVYVLSDNLQKIRVDIKGIKTVINSIDSPYNHGKYTLKRSNFTKWYSGLQSDYSSFNKNTLYSEVIAAFDALMAQHTDYITKTTLGTASGTDAGGNAYTLYEYVFTPQFYSNVYTDIKRPKIYMDGSIHGFEKNSTFGLYYFLKDLAEHWDENETLAALRECVEFHIIPVVNPYGFDRNKYTNANGVNLNRNFAHPGEWVIVLTPDTEINGEEAFDQPESQIVRDWLLNDEDSILMYFNCHTNGFTSAGYGEMNVCLTSGDRVDDYFNKLFDALTMHLNRQTLMLTKNYQSINPSSGEICGHIGVHATSTSTKGHASAWANTMRSMLAMTLEGFNELSDDEDNVIIANFSDESKKINSEIIGNILAQIIMVYSNY